MHQTKEDILFDKLITVSKLSWIDRIWFYSKLNKEQRVKVLKQIRQIKKMNEQDVNLLLRKELVHSTYTQPISSIIETLNTKESNLTQEVQSTIKYYLSELEETDRGS